MQRFIVGEVTKTWHRPDATTRPGPSDCLCGKFELVIAANLDRGYRLHSWKMTAVMVGPECLTETIVAVFERDTPSDSPPPRTVVVPPAPHPPTVPPRVPVRPPASPPPVMMRSPRLARPAND